MNLKPLLCAAVLLTACSGSGVLRGSSVEKDGQLQVAVLDQNLGAAARGGSLFALAPVSQATVTWYGGDETQVSRTDSQGHVPRLKGYDGFLVVAPGYAPQVYFGWEDPPRVAMLAQRKIQAAPVMTTLDAALIVGRVFGYTPSDADHQSEVKVYWRNQTAATIDITAASDTDLLAVQALFDDRSNFVRIWLPPGDNELFFFEKIYKVGNRNEFGLGRALYFPQYRVTAGMALTTETFGLGRLPDQTTCYGAYSYRGSIRIRWPDLDRSFIRAATGRMQVQLSLLTPGGLLAALASGNYDHRRIRQGNAMSYVYPLPLTGDLAGASYIFASSATHAVSDSLGEQIRFAEVRTQEQPCDIVPDQPTGPPPMEYPPGGTTLETGNEWTFRWSTMGSSTIDLAPEILIRRFDPNLSWGQGAVVLRLIVNTSRVRLLPVAAIPEVFDILPPGEYVLQVASDDTKGQTGAWLQDPVKWSTDRAELPRQFRQHQGSWIQYRRFTVR